MSQRIETLSKHIEKSIARVLACIDEKPQDVAMSLWLKRIMGISTCICFAFAYYLQEYNTMALLGAAFALWVLDAELSRKKIRLYIDLICCTAITCLVAFIFMSGDMGQLSCFMMTYVAVISVFLLGLKWGCFIAFANVIIIAFVFKAGTVEWIYKVYTKEFIERFPYMMFSFILVAVFVQFGMTEYWISKRQYRDSLESMIKAGREERTEVSLKVLTTMNKAMMAKSPDIGKHSEETAEWSRNIAESMGPKGVELRHYYYAGLLHDIGKIGLPDVFWDKSELTDDEYEEYKKHVDMGKRILENLQLQHITDAALYHHEKWDGSGYKGLKGEEIPNVARVVGVANFITRELNKGNTYDELITELNEHSDEAYDKTTVDCAILAIKKKIQLEEEERIFGKVE